MFTQHSTTTTYTHTTGVVVLFHWWMFRGDSESGTAISIVPCHFSQKMDNIPELEEEDDDEDNIPDLPDDPDDDSTTFLTFPKLTIFLQQVLHTYWGFFLHTCLATAPMA